VPAKSDFMSLDNFQITQRMVCEMYKDSLVVLDDRQIITDSLKSEDIQFLGGNEKNISIFVNDPESIYLNETNLQFLTKILTQCNLTLADVSIINTANIPGISFHDVSKKLKPSQVIGFGMNHNNLAFPVSIKNYEVLINEETYFLFASDLHLLKDDKMEKKELWICLKKMFSIQ